jgi:hypothetical protein
MDTQGNAELKSVAQESVAQDLPVSDAGNQTAILPDVSFQEFYMERYRMLDDNVSL